MKKAIHISGIFGSLIILIGILGYFMEFQRNNILFLAGLSILAVVFLPLLLIARYRQDKKIDAIIASYRNNPQHKKVIKEGKIEEKGWNINNSPYRKRKSGLTWGGGNIKAAEAQRGNRRSFLK